MASQQNARPRKNILVLDGGGVRGLSSLIILRHLLERVQRIVETEDAPSETAVKGTPQETNGKLPLWLKPHHVFDLVVGTSTGGLIAVMIGKLGMPVGECIKRYRELSRVIFREGRHLRGMISFGLWRERYSEEVLSREIEKVFANQGRSATETMQTYKDQKHEEHAYSAVVCNQYEDIPDTKPQPFPQPALICSHPCKDFRPKVSILCATRATSAAPTYFKPQRVERDRKVDLILYDGGILFNNPTLEAWHHYGQDYHEGLKWRKSRLVSLGTGAKHANRAPTRTRLQQWIRLPSAFALMKEAVVNSEWTAEK